jgi:hypothetical protein
LLEAVITGSTGYEIGVTTAVTPILSLGFCEAKTDARYDYGPQKTCSINRKLLF